MIKDSVNWVARFKHFIMEFMYRSLLLTGLLRYLIHHKRKSEVLFEVERICKASLASNSKFIIHHFNDACPATFGDYLEVLMFARLLALNGIQLEFILVALSAPHGSWKALSYEERLNFEREQQKLAQVILPSNVTFTLTGKSDITQISNSLKFVLFENRLRNNLASYDLIPALLHELISRGLLVIPQNFLLSEDWIGVPNHVPIIGWHVRDGLWETQRNLNENTILNDFIQIRKMYPNDSIMIFSSPSGVLKTMSVLRESKLLDAAYLEGIEVFEQPELGFTNALRYLLHSKFYFQRLGGGIGIVPIFSTIPYIMVSGDENYYFYRAGTKLVPWSRDDQMFLVRPSSAGTRSWARESRTLVKNQMNIRNL